MINYEVQDALPTFFLQRLISTHARFTSFSVYAANSIVNSYLQNWHTLFLARNVYSIIVNLVYKFIYFIFDVWNSNFILWCSKSELREITTNKTLLSVDELAHGLGTSISRLCWKMTCYIRKKVPNVAWYILLHLDPALFLQSLQRILDDIKHASFKKYYMTLNFFLALARKIKWFIFS